jgi:hypothetical protein
VSAASATDFARPASTLRYAEVDGLWVLLDLTSATYKVLDDSASALWSILIGRADRDVVFGDLMRRFDVGADQLAAELDDFAATCRRTGLLVDNPSVAVAGPPTHLGPRRGVPRAVFALQCLVGTQRALTSRGFRDTYESYARIGQPVPRGDLDAALTAFVRAENFFISRRAPNDCLIRSLALFRLLRASGFQVEHVIGVQRVPFEAHAWVELGGEPLLDDQATRFTPLARIGQ